MFVEEFLKLVQLFIVLEVGEGMGFFLGGDLHAADDHQALFAAYLLGHLNLSRRVVVADGDDV